MKKVTVWIDEWGNANLQTEGYQGTECLEATRLLEVGLGLKEDDSPTPEMFNGLQQSLDNQ